MKSAKGNLKQQLIEFQKFSTGRSQINKEVISHTMGHVTRIMSGVQSARKSIKLSERMDTSNRPQATEEFWNNLKVHAKSLGIDLIGFTEVDEYYIFEEEMVGYRVKNKVLDNAIVLGMEMKKEAINQAPEPPAGNEAMRVYADLGAATVKLAEHLREKGFRAQAFHPFGGPVLYPPMAEKAGLGEIGVNGLLITREFGPSLRLSTIATDAGPLPETKPSAMRVKDFCKNCGACVKKCPGNAILAFDEKIIRENGKYLTSIDSEKCFPHFFKTYGCSICIKTCPFFKVGYEKVMAKASIKTR
ncbi:MAG: epoxyqueuosine reductase [Candidatus Helarchaeota archaeon]|nr:epoxyqueuosine reductase [Candidatus Helarchaeota archaeon]